MRTSSTSPTQSASVNMNETCRRDDNLTTSFYWTMHLTLIISFPVNTVGLFCVIFKSPSYMQRYKWCLVHHMFWVMILDMHITTLIIPDFLFPLAAVHVMGLLIKFFPIQILALFGISSAGALVATLLHEFVYRHQAILPEYHKRHLSVFWRRFILGIIYVYFCGVSIPILLMIPNDQMKVKLKTTKTNCVPKELFENDTVVLDEDNSVFMYIYMLIFVFFGAFIGGGLMADAFRYLNSAVSQLSNQVKLLHLGALRMLIIQVAVPALLLGVPMSILLIGSILEYTNQALTCAVMQIVAFHGTIGTITMVLLNPSYRKFILNQVDMGRTVQITPVTTITRVNDELKRF